MNTIGIDIGGTSLRIGIIDDKFRLLDFKKLPQSDVLKENPVFCLANFIEEYIENNKVGICAICIGLPATIDKTRSTVLNAPNIKGLDNINIKSFLENRLNCQVFIEKDVVPLFYYDLHRYNIDNSGVIMACYVGTGLGNVISIDGKILTGNNGVAGELGHIPMFGFEEVCGCGNLGCAEILSGGKYLAKIHQKEFSDTSIDKLFIKHNDKLEGYLKNLALPIATEINILDPKVVILGGGVISMPDFPKEILEKHMRNYTRKPLPEANLDFVYSLNGGENGVIGAGIIAFNLSGKCVK